MRITSHRIVINPNREEALLHEIDQLISYRTLEHAMNLYPCLTEIYLDLKLKHTLIPEGPKNEEATNDSTR